MKHGKKYNESIKKFDHEKDFEPLAACALVKELHFAKFDETVEVHVRLHLKKSQSVRDTVVLPHQFRGEKKILVFHFKRKKQYKKLQGHRQNFTEGRIKAIEADGVTYNAAN